MTDPDTRSLLQQVHDHLVSVRRSAGLSDGAELNNAVVDASDAASVATAFNLVFSDLDALETIVKVLAGRLDRLPTE
ncbi:MAG TPA: hypothetical protein VMR18_00955 [Candidatus Saccharimonadales bacterium]|nr:hypothetical protein [Candidatus Saccharimonadales bacterium]